MSMETYSVISWVVTVHRVSFAGCTRHASCGAVLLDRPVSTHRVSPFKK
jgi:hypothetical protein